MSAKRREWKSAGSDIALAVPHTPLTESSDDRSEHPAARKLHTGDNKPSQRFNLARGSEALFTRGSPLNLPTTVFAGISALGFLSYILGIHSVTYVRADGVVKQVGFLWTANWTCIFMVFLPLFIAFVTELVTFWKDEGHLNLTAQGNLVKSDDAWVRNVESTSISYWAVLLICVLFAGLFQWIGVSLIPLMKGGGNYATDWGKLAIVRPEVISVSQELLFTGLAYLYMSFCFYLFFAGLILLYTVIDDLWRIGEADSILRRVESQQAISAVSQRVMRGIFRCTVLGVLIAIVMKLQSAYLASRGENILTWLVADTSSAFYRNNDLAAGISYRRPTYYSSLLIAISTCFVFVYACIRLGVERMPLWRMSAVVALLVACYLLINAFAGFSILLAAGVPLAIIGLLNPEFRRWGASEIGGDQSVP